MWLTRRARDCFRSHSSGIGFAAVQHLARRGAKVYMAARNEERAKAALARLRAEGLGKGEVVWMELDLEQPKRIAEYVAKFTEKETRLDILSESATFLYAQGR